MGQFKFIILITVIVLALFSGCIGKQGGTPTPTPTATTTPIATNGATTTPIATNGAITTPIATTAAGVASTISIASLTVSPGGTVTVTIMANNITNVEAYTISLNYNQAVVVVDSVGAGDMGGVTANINNAAGVTQMSAFILTPQSGNVTLANVTLRAIGTAGQTSPLNLTVTTLSDNNGNPIPETVNNGMFTISAV
jgi:hypothetical protein